MSRRSRKSVQWIANVLLIAGILAVVVSVGSFVSMKWWEYSQNRAFERQRAAVSHGRMPPRTEVRNVPNGAIVGRLSIPRLHVRAMIRQGVTSPILRVALGHIPGTAFPGQPGNIGIAGHRDTLFRALRNIAANDEITFETPQATYTYRVKSTQIVNPEDVAVLNPGRGPELTLVTCYPFEYIGAAPRRFIVKATLVSRNADRNDIPQTPLRMASTRRPHAAPMKPGTVDFSVPQGHSRELVPGKIWLGVDSADSGTQTVDGWLWVMPDRHTTWLRHTDAHDPVVFYQDGERRELFITSIGQNSAKGFIVDLPVRG